MIQPISIDMTPMHITVSEHMCKEQEEIGQSTRVEACSIASGIHRDKVIAFIRYLPNEETIGNKSYPWQVIKANGSFGYTHKSCVSSLEQAMHLVMSLAYEYVAFN